MLKIRRSRDSLIFNMGILIPGKDGLYIETGPRGWQAVVSFVNEGFVFSQWRPCMLRSSPPDQYRWQSNYGALHTWMSLLLALWSPRRSTTFILLLISIYICCCRKIHSCRPWGQSWDGIICGSPWITGYLCDSTMVLLVFDRMRFRYKVDPDALLMHTHWNERLHIVWLDRTISARYSGPDEIWHCAS